MPPFDPFGYQSVARALDRLTTALNAQHSGLVVQLTRIEGKVNTMAGELDTLKAAVAANTTVIGSAIALIQGIKAKLDAAIAAGDPAALTALSAELGAQDQALSDAVTANTPAE